MSIGDRLSDEEVLQRIGIILKEGSVILTHHCRKESLPNRGIEMTDVIHALKRGHVAGTEWDETHLQWKYRIKGTDIEGDELTSIVIVITTELKLVVVTVF